MRANSNCVEPLEVALLGEREIGGRRFGAQAGQDGMLEGLFCTGIDDLAKYRIVQYLQECSRPLDVDCISSCLGLHPIELVAEALDSLECRGIVVREGQDPAVYAINCHASLLYDLQRLNACVSPQERESVFKALAASSLAKARARKRGERGGSQGKD